MVDEPRSPGPVGDDVAGADLDDVLMRAGVIEAIVLDLEVPRGDENRSTRGRTTKAP